MPKLIIKIVNSGTIYSKDEKTHKSLSGHMWLEIRNDDGEFISGGFAGVITWTIAFPADTIKTKI